MSYPIIAAIALLLILEGFLPFIAPHFWRFLVLSMAKKSDRALRITGLICMLIGVILLVAAHQYIN